MHIRQLMFLLMLFVAFPATASAQSIYVLGINSIEGDDEPARFLTRALRSTFAEQGCTVATGEASLAQMQLAFSDGGLCNQMDVECLDAIARHIEAPAMVIGIMHRVFTDVGQEIEVELHYFDRLERRIISHYTTRMAIAPSAEEVRVIAQTAAPELIRCVRPEVVSPPLPVDEDETGPSEPPGLLPEDPFDAPRPSAPAPSSYNHEWVGWSLIGLGAALLVADIPVWIRLNDMNNDPSLIDYRHRLAFGATGDACSNAAAGDTLMMDGLDPTMATSQVAHVRNLCSEGATLEVLQYVFLMAGIVSAGTGATLLATGVLVSPSVSTERATITVSGSF